MGPLQLLPPKLLTPLQRPPKRQPQLPRPPQRPLQPPRCRIPLKPRHQPPRCRIPPRHQPPPLPRPLLRQSRPLLQPPRRLLLQRPPLWLPRPPLWLLRCLPWLRSTHTSSRTPSIIQSSWPSLEPDSFSTTPNNLISPTNRPSFKEPKVRWISSLENTI